MEGIMAERAKSRTKSDDRCGIAIDVLLIGILEMDSEGNVVAGGTSSSSVLIRAPGRNIVVDTGAPLMASGIKTAFKQIGIFRDDVDTVVLTHNHSDHTGNVKMFPKAKILAHSGGTPFAGAEIIDRSEYEICPGVKMVHTPGHTEDSCSVFVDADRRYAIVGDACPLKANFTKKVPPALNCDSEAALTSLKKIEEYADVVIPGHDAPFFTRRAGGAPKQHKSRQHGNGGSGRSRQRFRGYLWIFNRISNNVQLLSLNSSYITFI